jgi:hypothetical protein
MLTDADISDLWQFAHLKFHFGENLACKAISSPTLIVDRAAPRETLMAGAGNSAPQESTRKPVDLGTLESSKRDEEISYLWQFAHLRFHFGEKLAVHSMQSVDNSATESATCWAENEFRLNLLYPESLDSEAGRAVFGKKSAEDGAGSKSFPEQSRQEPVAPQALNPATRIA